MLVLFISTCTPIFSPRGTAYLLQRGHIQIIVPGQKQVEPPHYAYDTPNLNPFYSGNRVNEIARRVRGTVEGRASWWNAVFSHCRHNATIIMWVWRCKQPLSRSFTRALSIIVVRQVTYANVIQQKSFFFFCRYARYNAFMAHLWHMFRKSFPSTVSLISWEFYHLTISVAVVSKNGKQLWNRTIDMAPYRFFLSSQSCLRAKVMKMSPWTHLTWLAALSCMFRVRCDDFRHNYLRQSIVLVFLLWRPVRFNTAQQCLRKDQTDVIRTRTRIEVC